MIRIIRSELLLPSPLSPRQYRQQRPDFHHDEQSPNPSGTVCEFGSPFTADGGTRQCHASPILFAASQRSVAPWAGTSSTITPTPAGRFLPGGASLTSLGWIGI